MARRVSTYFDVGGNLATERAVKSRKRKPPRKVTESKTAHSTNEVQRSSDEAATKSTTGSNSAAPHELPNDATAPAQANPAGPRIFYGLNVDELSSDSDLTDVPEDIGCEPFTNNRDEIPESARGRKRKIAGHAEVVAVKKKKPVQKLVKKSPYFPYHHKHRPTFLSTLPFPPLDAERFGLMQERLAHEPFRLLLATIFLNKTRGAQAMPVFFELMRQYPTPQDLANAQQADVTKIIHHLGFQNQRARKCIAMAQKWVEAPPVKGRRYRKLHYPRKADGADVKDGETIDDDDVDARVAWEISHLPGLGPYSHDSWRMFCRDEMRGLATSWNGENAKQSSFEPEWKRVLPTDKELRAWMTWMWMKEGLLWNKDTGACTNAPSDLLELARNSGNVVLEDVDNSMLLVKSLGAVRHWGLFTEAKATQL